MIKDAYDSGMGSENVLLLTSWPRRVGEPINFEQLQWRKLDSERKKKGLINWMSQIMDEKQMCKGMRSLKIATCMKVQFW